jgi:hypothetical protein
MNGPSGLRYELEAGTDAASLLLFDPLALPADFDLRTRSDPAEDLGELQDEGRACWIQTQGDGTFLLHVYVDQSLPVELAPYLREPEVLEEFVVPSGRLYLTGVEYAFREDDSLLRKYPHMGGSVSIPAGAYRLTVYRAIYPKGLAEVRFRAGASLRERLSWNSMRLLIPLAVAAWIGLVVIFFTNVRVPFPQFLAPALGLVFALPFLARRLPIYREAKASYARQERECPSFVVQLERFVAYLE